MKNKSHHRLSRISKYLALGLWVGVVVITYTLLRHYIDEEHTRHVKRWEQRLSVVAYAQSEQIGNWLDAKQQAVQTLAEDVSLRLYLSTSDESEERAAQQTYLRNYIIATAKQAGFTPPPSATDHIRANIDKEQTAGLAVVTPDGKPVVSTVSMPLTENVMPHLSFDRPFGVTGPVPLGSGTLSLLFHAAIYPVQGDASTDEPVGFVVAAITPENTVFPYLKKGEAPDTPASSMLLGLSKKSVWTNLSPLWNERAPLTFSIDKSQPDAPAIVMAANEPNTLIQARDLTHLQSLAFAIKLPAEQWTLVRRVSHDRAFADLNTRMQWLHAAYWLMVLTISLMVVALWRHVTADKLAKLLGKIRAHEELLTLVTERIPAGLFITDSKHRLRYANESIAKKLHMTQSDLIDKTLASVMGNHAAAPYLDANIQVINAQEPHTRWHEEVIAEKVVSATEIQHIPLLHIPSKQDDANEAGVLIIEHDLTDAIQAKHATQLTLNKLIETLVMLVDTRDPHAAKHSSGVAMIARSIAKAMSLDTQSTDTVAIAGRLMNVGKLLVPVDLLTSEKPLNEGDKAQIQHSLQAAIKHLEPIPFDGPVVETLKQSQECPDGSGPLGMKEDQILQTALVLAAANGFVALTSPRSYRAGKTIDEAMAILQEETGSRYARPVVSALAHYLDNMDGRSIWEAFHKNV